MSSVAYYDLGKLALARGSDSWQCPGTPPWAPWRWLPTRCRARARASPWAMGSMRAPGRVAHQQQQTRPWSGSGRGNVAPTDCHPRRPVVQYDN